MRVLILAVGFLIAARGAQGAELVVSETPDGAHLVVEDIARFWEAWDLRGGALSLEQLLQTHYIDEATPGLEDFVAARIGSAAELAELAEFRSDYYDALRPATLRVAEFEPAVRKSFEAMEELYPESMFPDVYFVIGRMNSGGTTSHRGLLIGVDIYGRGENVPMAHLDDWAKTVIKPIEDLPHIVAHELIHYQQADLDGEPDLLAKCIHEGMGDFLGELISGKHINAHVHEWALPREAELWAQFQEVMHQEDHTGWLYGGQPEGWPADLGYFVGYRICQAYYERADDKAAAVRELLLNTDGDELLAESGYAPTD